jgi:hypothetical protein
MRTEWKISRGTEAGTGPGVWLERPCVMDAFHDGKVNKLKNPCQSNPRLK